MSHASATPVVCPQCQRPLPAGAVWGVCPACLLAAGIPTLADEPAAQPAPLPSLEELAADFPQLELLELIGRGGMGAVYKARQRNLDRVVALKLLRPGLDADPDFAARFTREARALAQLNHPGIVTLYEFGRTPAGRFFILMEFVDGVNLRQLLAAGRLSPREALAIVPPLCDALQYAHDRGLVHRDIKPENILIDRLGRVKIADFGLAKAIAQSSFAHSTVSSSEPSANRQRSGADSAADATEAGKVLGTPRYMAPEQRERPAEVDHRADLYALGVVFYQMLTGELPDEQHLRPSSRVQIDVRLDEIVLRALQRDPLLRYAAASDFKTQVESVTGPAKSASPSAPPLPRRRTVALLLAAAVFAVALAVFIVVGGRGTPVAVDANAHAGRPLAAAAVQKPTTQFLAEAVPVTFDEITARLRESITRGAPEVTIEHTKGRFVAGINTGHPETDFMLTVTGLPEPYAGKRTLPFRFTTGEPRLFENAGFDSKLRAGVHANLIYGSRLKLELLGEIMRLIGPLHMPSHRIKSDDGVELTVYDEVFVTENDLASIERGKSAEKPGLRVTFTDAGAFRLNQLSQFSQGRHVAVVVNGRLIARPLVTTPVEGPKMELPGALLTEQEFAGLLAALPAPPANQQAEVADAALAWLKVVDAGLYSESWRQSAAVFRKAVKEPVWLQNLNASRTAMGAAKERRLVSTQSLETLPGVTDGPHLVFQFSTRFSAGGLAVETVTFTRESDGGWRCSGYYIKPDGMSAAATAEKVTERKPVASETAVPELRAIDWLDHVEGCVGRAWLPTGEDAPAREWRPPVSGLSNASQPLIDDAPRYLCLWFSHPAFDRFSIAEVTLTDASTNEALGGPGLHVATGFNEGPMVRNSGAKAAWITTTLAAGTLRKTPERVGVTLRYSVSEWHFWDELPVGVKGRRALANGVSVGEPGQGADGRAFVELTRDTHSDTQTEQFDFVALSPDGRRFERAATSRTTTGRAINERFMFDSPLGQVRAFEIRKRNVASMAWTAPLRRGRIGHDERALRFDRAGDTMQGIVHRLRRDHGLRLSFENLDFTTADAVTLGARLRELEAIEARGNLDDAEVRLLRDARRLHDVEKLKDETLIDVGVRYRGVIQGNNTGEFLERLTAGTPYSARKINLTWVIAPRTGSRLTFPVTLNTTGLTMDEAVSAIVAQDRGEKPIGTGLQVVTGAFAPGSDPQPWRSVRAEAFEFKQQPAVEVLCWLTDAARPGSVWELSGYRGGRNLTLVPAPGDRWLPVIQEAQGWLIKIDAGTYAESWTGAAVGFRKGITQAVWAAAVAKHRGSLGNVVRRRLLGVMPSQGGAATGMAAGGHLIMQFQTELSGQAVAIETVTFSLEPDGEWRASGYFIK